MDYSSVIDKILKYVAEKTIFDKYNFLYEKNVLEAISYDKAISKFSVGLLFLLLKKVDLKSPSDEDIMIAGEIQLIFLSADLYDDAFDQDNQDLSYMSNNNIVLLATELLIESMKKLSLTDGFALSIEYLQVALEGEFYDINTSIMDDFIDENLYLEKILKKSIGLFKFFFMLADSKRFNTIWSLFAEKYAIFLQLGNDYLGAKSEEYSDIELKKVTFPLLKLSEEIAKDKLRKMNQSEFQKKFAEFGVLEYNLFIHKTLKIECLNILENFNIDQEVIEYLRLGDN